MEQLILPISIGGSRPIGRRQRDYRRIIPLTLREANAFVTKYHRHHGAVVGHRFSIGVIDPENVLHGVAAIGRPVSRHVDQYRVCEITRLCSDGIPNVCSKLYGAVKRIAREMGFECCITYTLASETGASLRAAGWVAGRLNHGGTLNRPG